MGWIKSLRSPGRWDLSDWKYRNVLARDGGPVSELAIRELEDEEGRSFEA